MLPTWLGKRKVYAFSEMPKKTFVGPWDLHHSPTCHLYDVRHIPDLP